MLLVGRSNCCWFYCYPSTGVSSRRLKASWQLKRTQKLLQHQQKLTWTRSRKEALASPLWSSFCHNCVKRSKEPGDHHHHLVNKTMETMETSTIASQVILIQEWCLTSPVCWAMSPVWRTCYRVWRTNYPVWRTCYRAWLTDSRAWLTDSLV